MLRFALVLILLVFIARAFWRLVDGVIEGVTGRPVRRGPRGRSASRAPERSVQMSRDPVCGTFVVPDSAIILTDGSRRIYFCSARCRDQYRARPSARPDASGRAEGRTA